MPRSTGHADCQSVKDLGVYLLLSVVQLAFLCNNRNCNSHPSKKQNSFHQLSKFPFSIIPNLKTQESRPI
jgi:hypothetical protein